MTRTVIPHGAHLVPPDAECVFKGIIHDVYQWQQQLFDGSWATFEMLKRPDTVKVIAIKDGRIVMLDEQQPHYGRGFELPGGRHDAPAEDELACAKREMHEETGMTFKTWRLIDASQSLSKIEAFLYIYLATDFESQGDMHLDAGERITVCTVEFKDFIKQVNNSKHGAYLPASILERAQSIEELLGLPEYA